MECGKLCKIRPTLFKLSDKESRWPPPKRVPLPPLQIRRICSDEAQAIAEALDGQGMSGLVADHVLRKHVFPLFVLTAVFVALYVAYKIVGDPLLQLIKVSHRKCPRDRR